MHTFPSLLYTLDSPCPTCAHLCPCFPPLFRLTKTRSGWVLGTGSICSGGGRNKDKESRILSNIEVRPSEARDWRLPRCFPSLVSSTKGDLLESRYPISTSLPPKKDPIKSWHDLQAQAPQPCTRRASMVLRLVSSVVFSFRSCPDIWEGNNEEKRKGGVIQESNGLT